MARRPTVTGMSTDDTAASEHGADAETTRVPPPPPDDEPGLAWSVDDDEMSTNRHGRLVWAGLAVLVVAVTAALVLLVSTLFGRHTTNNPRPQPVPSPPVTTAVAAAPAPTATVTVSVAPVPTTSPPETEQDKDSRFLALMATQHLSPTSFNRIAEAARNLCVEIATGDATKRSTIAYLVGGHPPLMTLDQATFYVNTAVNTYCPQYNND